MKFSFCILVFSFLLFLPLKQGVSSVINKDISSETDILFIKDDNYAGQSLFYNDIIELGYGVQEIRPDKVTVEIMNQYRMVILSAGSSPVACENSLMRLAIQSYIIKFSGKVIIEGGHTGYISAVYPFYLGFRNKVIMIDDWISDNGGDLVISSTHTQSNLANSPNVLSAVIGINFVNNYYQDVCTNNKFTELFYGTNLYGNKVGILVFPGVDEPQVINYFFYYSALENNADAKKLLENSIYNLIGKPIAVTGSHETIPEDFKLYQNYPNPFNPVTMISYSLSKTGFISIKIVNILGSEVAEIVNKKQNAGNYEVYWDAAEFSNGVYICAFSVNGQLFDSKSMLLIK